MKPCFSFASFSLLIALCLMGVLLSAPNPAAAAEVVVSKPRALKPGDTIAIVAPAYPLREDRIDVLEKRLRAMGFKVRRAPNLFVRYGYLAGDDETRAAELMRALLDPEVDAVFPGTGGYGLSRILNRLDYEALRGRPKIVIGFSDITALHLALNKRLGWIVFHSPNPMYGLGYEAGLDPFTEKLFWRGILAERYFDAKGNRIGPGWTYEFDSLSTRPVTLVGGVGEGRLTGGNLSLVAALMGTPHEIETKRRILFLEDVGEAPYRIDRMLAQLEMAGKLEGLAGVLLGMWRNCAPDDPEISLTLDQVFDRYFAGKPYPVVKNFPVGHVRQNATLPIGALARLNGDTGRFELLEDPVAPPSPPGGQSDSTK